jgi:uncharacterized protein (TIGR02118 family)
MHKLMLLFRPPTDIERFEQEWSRSFVPAAERMPGIRRITVSRAMESLGGPLDLYLVHEFFFESLLDARNAMASPSGEAAGRALMAFASGAVTLCLAEHLEEDLAPGSPHRFQSPT